MSLATLRLGRIKGVSRPAICTAMPSVSDKPSVILDAGANTDCKAKYLIDFAIMGYEYAKSVMGYENVRVGLLSNGENVEQAISLSVFLYYAMAATMMLSIFLACGVIIYRLVNKKTYSETTAKEVSSVIKIAVVGEIISILLAWLLS